MISKTIYSPYFEIEKWENRRENYENHKNIENMKKYKFL
jgi:hypothetical protein